MDEKIKFSSNVILIDAAFLNLVITDLKKYFERTLKRELQEIDLSELITYFRHNRRRKSDSNISGIR